MKVKDFIKALKKFKPNQEITITDGCLCIVYKGDFAFADYTEDNGEISVDIGIGYCKTTD